MGMPSKQMPQIAKPQAYAQALQQQQMQKLPMSMQRQPQGGMAGPNIMPKPQQFTTQVRNTGY